MLRGQRVIIRAIERGDLQRLHQLDQNHELVLLNREEWTPESLAIREHRFEKQLSDTPSWFVIEADGVVIGHIGLMQQSRLNGTAALGIGIFDPAYLGRGYGRDALNLFLGWAFQIQNWRKIWLTVLASNERALRAYRAVGFVEEARLREHTVFRGRIDDEIVMGLLREEWEARQPVADESVFGGATA